VKEVRVVDHLQAKQLDDAELVVAVSKAGGRVIVGFKPPSAGRTAETGLIPGMAPAEALASRAALLEWPVILKRTFRFSSDVVVQLPYSELAPLLRSLPFVNYVDPDHVGFPGQGSQDTAWGSRRWVPILFGRTTLRPERMPRLQSSIPDLIRPI